MQKSCPISLKQSDGTIARINAVFITLFIILFLVTTNNLILFALIYDFSVRIFGWGKYSPITYLSIWTKKILNLKTKMSDPAPKRLATFVGLIFLIFMLILSFLHYTFVLYTTGSILILFSSLEALFNYCVGCKIYYIYKKVPLKGL